MKGPLYRLDCDRLERVFMARLARAPATEIAAVLGVSAPRVLQLEQLALRRVLHAYGLRFDGTKQAWRTIMENQLHLDFARARGEVGIERAAARADRNAPGWIDRAAEFLRARARTFTGVSAAFPGMGTHEFTVESLRQDADEAIGEPPDLRAWGHVTRRAVRLGYIERIPGKFAAAASSNGSPKPLYRRGANA
jgi:hypothetical protein